MQALIPALLIISATTTSARLYWTEPTLNTDGSPITQPLTYNFYKGHKGAEVLFKTGLTSTARTVFGTAGKTICYQVTAVEDGKESARSNEVCWTF